MTNLTRNTPTPLLLLCTAIAMNACAGADEADSTSPVAPSGPHSLSRTDFPPGARVIEDDTTLPISESLARLDRASADKGFAVNCMSASYTWMAEATDQYVTVDLGNDNILRAQASTPQEWEELKLCSHGTTGLTYSFWSVAAGKFVTAEFAFAGSTRGVLRARADEVWEWETFVLQNTVFGIRYAIKARAVGTTGAWYYVSGEFGYGGNSYGMLRARATQIAEWEQWVLQRF